MISGLIVVALLTTLLTPVANAKSETNRNVLVPIDESLPILIPVEGLSDEELIEIIESEKDNFVDPTYGDYLIGKIKSDSSGEFQIQGKFTMTAKAAAKALKKAMNKIGEKSWNAMVKKIEKNFGFTLVWFHWKSMNGVINFLSDSNAKITDALTNFLVKKGVNKTLAKLISKAFVTVFF